MVSSMLADWDDLTGDRIVTAEGRRLSTADGQPIIDLASYRRWVEQLAIVHGVNPASLGDPNNPSGADVAAFVDFGRWLGQCECRSAMYLLDGQQAFMCGECFNAGNGRLWRPVVWPGNRTLLEAELVKRLDPRARCWLPHETLADLQAETVKLGWG